MNTINPSDAKYSNIMVYRSASFALWLLILHCDFGVIPTRNRDGEGHSVFCRVLTQRTTPPAGNFEIIAAPQNIETAEDTFTNVFLDVLKSQQKKTFTIHSVAVEMEEKLANIIRKNISPENTGRSAIRMTRTDPYHPRVSSEYSMSSSSRQDWHHSELDDNRWINSQSLKSLLAFEGLYNTVIVQPILWEPRVSDLSNLDREVNQLCNVFMRHFDFKISPTHLINDNHDRQDILAQKMRSFTNQTSPTALSENDLLIVLYNGHGGDGYDFNCNMIWS